MRLEERLKILLVGGAISLNIISCGGGSGESTTTYKDSEDSTIINENYMESTTTGTNSGESISIPGVESTSNIYNEEVGISTPNVEGTSNIYNEEVGISTPNVEGTSNIYNEEVGISTPIVESTSTSIGVGNSTSTGVSTSTSTVEDAIDAYNYPTGNSSYILDLNGSNYANLGKEYSSCEAFIHKLYNNEIPQNETSHSLRKYIHNPNIVILDKFTDTFKKSLAWRVGIEYHIDIYCENILVEKDRFKFKLTE
jgi:hypothetical protein